MTNPGAMRFLAAAALLAVALAACVPVAPRLADGAAVAGGIPIAAEHTLSPGDQIEIRFPFAADYNDRVTVGMDGTVSPTAVPPVRIGGLTVPEATARLTQHYAGLLRAPELSITVRRFAPEAIYVDGWVARPGLIRSDVPLTLARALAQAGGVKTGAQTSNVLIMRKTDDGAVQTSQVALGSFAGAGGQDPLLKSFDVVYVPQTTLAAVSEFARQYYANVPFSAKYDISPAGGPGIVAPVAPAPAVTGR